MSFLVPLTMFGWIPVVLLLFMFLPARRAVIVAFLIAWLFLPMAGYKVRALPDYTKMTATVFGVLLAAAIFDTDRLLSFRPGWVDIPMFVFCCSPVVTSVLHEIGGGNGIYDGASQLVTQFATWGLPYLIGRIYFNDLQSLRELAIGMLIGGVIYVPLCLIEMRLSPQLHLWVYGFHQHAFIQTIRDGGYRPMVFMQHGLMVAMWMSMTAMIGIILWRCRSIRTLWDIPVGWFVVPLTLVAIACRSKYALVLLLLGLGALAGTRLLRTKLGMLALACVPVIFIILRASMVLSGTTITRYARDMFGPERAQSLEFRFDSENAISGWALQDFWFGHGTWERVQRDDGKGDVVTDSLWIIVLGRAGVIGIAGLCGMLLLPIVLVCWDYRLEFWWHPMVAPTIALALVSMLYMFDHLFNGMVNPIFMLACGGVCAAHYTVPQILSGYLPQNMQRRPQPMFPQPQIASAHSARPIGS
jgi:hypothetical protein